MVHKTRKKPYHHVTYYHQWQSNRGVLEEKTVNRKRTTLPWFPEDQSKEKRIPRQPKRAQQIAKLRLFVWDIMPWTYSQRSMGMANRCRMKHIAWGLTGSDSHPRNWQGIAENNYANISAKTQLLHHRHMRVELAWECIPGLSIWGT